MRLIPSPRFRKSLRRLDTLAESPSAFLFSHLSHHR